MLKSENLKGSYLNLGCYSNCNTVTVYPLLESLSEQSVGFYSTSSVMINNLFKVTVLGKQNRIFYYF
jgi:hypothetical protein